MKKIILTSFLTFFAFAFSFAQTFITPNTGVIWTLDDIAAASPTTITVSGNTYTLLENLEIAENDTVIIDSDLTLLIDAALLVKVFGAFTVSANAVTITALEQSTPYDGFRFEELSVIDIKNATIEYGGGLRVLTETFAIDNCVITNNFSGATTSAVIQLSRGMPQITNNTISFNENPAIGSAANSAVSAYIFNNTIEGNNIDNANRPQINMGTTMANEPLQIIQNTIIGDINNPRAGGISVANFTGGNINTVIDGNTISNNRYGIAILGTLDSAVISNNIIEDNNIENNPNLGGSGINLLSASASNAVVVTGNTFRRNLWGITLQDQATINLGDDVNNPGGNTFSENGNNGEIYALYNNTPNAVSAKNNCWIEGQESTPEEVEDVIFHEIDDATLGFVTFDPFECGIAGINDAAVSNFSFYPNPVKNDINFNNIFSFEKVEIYGIQGNLISSEIISEGQQTLSIHLSTGLYFVKFSNDRENVTKKMIVQ